MNAPTCGRAASCVCRPRKISGEMGATGPCGPCSEIHYYLGDDLAAQDRQMLIDDTGDLVEIWNLVFIQYNRDETGALQPLPEKHVHTGMGFERMCSLLQGAESNYETDVFQPLIGRIAELTGKEYGGEHRVSMQVIADHVRALSFAMADGAMPSNEGRGYVLRRILRRAARYARQLDQHDPVIHQLVGTLGETMGHVFPEGDGEEGPYRRSQFARKRRVSARLSTAAWTFSRGSLLRDRLPAVMPSNSTTPTVFRWTSTELMAREQGIPLVEQEEFDRALEAQRQRARQATRAQFSATEGVGDTLEEAHSFFRRLRRVGNRRSGDAYRRG